MNRLISHVFLTISIIVLGNPFCNAQDTNLRTQVYGISNLLSYCQKEAGDDLAESVSDSRLLYLLQNQFDKHAELGSLRIDQLDYVRIRRDISSLIVRSTNEEHATFARLFYATMGDIPGVICQCTVVRVPPQFLDQKLRQFPLEFDSTGEQAFAHTKLSTNDEGVLSLLKKWGIDQNQAVSRQEFRGFSDSAIDIKFESPACIVGMSVVPRVEIEASKINLKLSVQEFQKVAPNVRPIQHSFRTLQSVGEGNTLLLVDLTPTNAATNQPATIKVYFFTPRLALSKTPLLKK